jgi:hypothetical protein
LTIDGVENVRACMTPVAEGMVIATAGGDETEGRADTAGGAKTEDHIGTGGGTHG